MAGKHGLGASVPLLGTFLSALAMPAPGAAGTTSAVIGTPPSVSGIPLAPATAAAATAGADASHDGQAGATTGVPASATLTATGLVLVASEAGPRDDAPPAKMTGDWGGLRTRLSQAGVDIDPAYESEFAANTRGGQAQSLNQAGQFSTTMKLDTEKLLGLKASQFVFIFNARNGHNLSDRAGLNTLMQVQEVFGRGNIARVTELSYRQRFFNNRFEVKLGRLPVSEGFNFFDCDFMNLTFCGAQSGNLADYWYNYPVSQWAARVKYRTRNWYIGTGAYEMNTRNLRTKFRVGYFRGASGVMVPLEVGWTPNLGAAGLPGIWRVGVWYDSSNADDVLLGKDHQVMGVRPVPALRRHARHGFYAQFKQQILGSAKDNGDDGRKTEKGLTVFLNFSHTDKHTQKLLYQLAGGMVWQAPFANRPKDAIAIAIGKTRVNRRWSRQNYISGKNDYRARSEYATELYYTLSVRDWMRLRPNVQYIWRAGGERHSRGIVIWGAKCQVDM